MAIYNDMPDKYARCSDKEMTGLDQTDILNTAHLLDPGDKLGFVSQASYFSPHYATVGTTVPAEMV